MDNRELENQAWADSNDVVSFDDEPLVLVDLDDREIGFLDKAAAHVGRGVLHRAFSLFVFNAQGELLLQRRAPGKRLWPGYWSNTCCSHPRRGETMEQAIYRRLREELGIECPLRFLYKFRYQAQFDAQGAEHELCQVYAGRSDATPTVNVNEISALRHVSPTVLDAEIAARPHTFTPWFKLEWQRLRSEHTDLFVPLEPIRSG